MLLLLLLLLLVQTAITFANAILVIATHVFKTTITTVTTTAVVVAVVAVFAVVAVVVVTITPFLFCHCQEQNLFLQLFVAIGKFCLKTLVALLSLSPLLMQLSALLSLIYGYLSFVVLGKNSWGSPLKVTMTPNCFMNNCCR